MANLADHLFKQAQTRGQKIALIYEGRSYTFADISDRVRAIAGGLADVGVGVGTRVGLMVNSQPEFIFFQQAVFALGGIVSPLNIFYKRGDLAHAIFCCDLEILIIGQEFLENLPALGTRGTESLRLVIALGLDSAKETEIVKSAERVAQSKRVIDAPVSLSGRALGLMLNTSATTGKAKSWRPMRHVCALHDLWIAWLRSQ